MRAPALAALIGLLAFAALPARAEELAGTYAGELTCQLTGGTVSAVPTFLTISQRSGGLFAEIDGVRYGLRAQDGDAAFRRCGAINPQYGETSGAEQVSVASDASGAPVIRLASHSAFGLCRATWTRIDPRDPGVPACGE